jgi:hypothetical protein
MATIMTATKPIASVQDALKLIDSFSGNPRDFELAVADALNDAIGINMAIITERILKRGWEPDGFTQESGYRLYKYKNLG